MLNLKKFYSDELLQLALLLSLLRVDPDAYLGLDIQTIGVGSLDLNNGSGWHTDDHTIVHRPAFVHPKNLDSVLLNYERDLFEDLNALGRYNRINTAQNDIHAYLLNIDERAGPSAVSVNTTTENARNAASPNPPMPSRTTDESLEAAELTQEDMDLIEVLWKQDVDLGFSLVDPVHTGKNTATSSNKESEDDIEKLKALEAINAADDKKEPDIKEEPPKEEDPWAGLPYTVDLETGEYILNGDPDELDLGAEQHPRQESCEADVEEEEDDDKRERLLGDASLGELVGLGEDSLGLNDASLGLENDFTRELLGDGSCLLDGCGAVDGFLSNDSLGLPDGFNLEEALQLVGIDEVQLEKPEVKKKRDEDNSDGARSESRASTSADDEDAKTSEDSTADSMIHTPQYHHPHHSHHRSFQSRVPFVRTMSMDQRWEIAPFFSVGGGGEHFVHPGHHHHHHHHPSYTSLGASTTTTPGPHHHGHYEAAQRNVLLHNATLAPPVGDLNSTGTYHNTGGPSNLGSAVATSMNLTNSSEPMGTDSGAGYKSEPSDMMYYPNATADTMNQTTDSIFSALLDEQLGWNEDLAFNVSDGLYGGASGAAGATATLPGMQGAGANHPGAAVVLPGATATGTTDERMDASSDSAVSSMGSERVPSLSDGEWMETGSNSSHTQADSHYSMDYTGKYRMPYDCGYSLPTGRGGRSCQAAERGGLTPVAQKKHHMFGKRCVQEPGPMPAGSPLASAHHPAAATPLKYDYEAAQSVAAGPPAQAYSGPIEGATGPQPEIKYSCSVDFSRHQASARSNLEHVHHNHTYHLPPENSGALQRPISRDKKARKNEGEEHLTRDEKRARALNVPIPVSDIINLPMDEFNERLSKYDLSETQLSLIRDIRRRGKNKVAAQNCRKRKLDQINSLSDEVKEMRNRKMRLISERNYMLQEVARVKEKFGQLYRHIFHSLRDPDGHPYNTMEYSLQLSADGNVVLVPRSNQSSTSGSNGHYTRSTMDPSKQSGKPDHHHHHHQEHKE